jgi:hypothetical protein
VVGLLGRQEIEPFVERDSLRPIYASDSPYRFGYRVVGTDTVVAAIEIPASLVFKEISSRLRLSCRLTPDGNVAPEVSFQGDFSCSTAASASPRPIDQLVISALAPEDLRMEEATIADLVVLLQRLKDSADLVRSALTRRIEKANSQSCED